MTRLIDADALARTMYEESFEKDSDMQRWDSGCWIRYKLFENVLDDQPTIDAEPVRHGKWIKIHPQGIYECSECHQNVMTSDIDCYKFCHQCGVRMDEE